MQDGGYPELVNWVMEAGEQPAAIVRTAKLAWRLLKLWLRLGGSSDVGADLASFIGPASVSSTTLPLFSMGRDLPDGTLSLDRHHRLAVDWRKDGSPVFEQIRRTGREVARALDGSFRDNPPWWLGRVVTVHPLGGCPMGRDASEGVVDSFGRVFGHEHLIVADGSVMPGPVGPNPSNTIAALAHRFAERLIAEA
jgi:cholesterol oxidase